MPVNIGNLAKEYCSLDSWRKRLPITLWLPRYKPAFVIRDVIAGLTVAITVIPQGMAYASIAKLSIEYGLYSSFMCCFVYVLLGTTRDMAIGPTSVMSLLVSSYGQVSAVNPDHNDHVYAVILAFFVGIVQFSIGLFHLGSLTSFISSAVVSSFTSASAIIVIVDQLRVILGLTFESSSFIQNFIETLVNIPKTRPWDLLLGSVCMIVLLLLQALKDQILRWEKDETYEPHRLQRYIWNLLWLVGIARYAIIILFSGVTAWILEETGKSDYITLTGPITDGLPPFAVPAFNTPDWFEVHV
ncbi:sodium-independent sulfate anion transporter-like [Patiria miniata]|uniref:SLC26A/SulP transporter domain-containing protein n=1 Tax=Patiria miniata TaxID=46514 RepID=A0A914ARX0_PATMI|nr:sodium-independent sulfate anion transporter-like [Patiria miniata]